MIAANELLFESHSGVTVLRNAKVKAKFTIMKLEKNSGAGEIKYPWTKLDDKW